MTELIKQKKQVPERLYSNKKLAALLIPLALDQLLNSFMGRKYYPLIPQHFDLTLFISS